MIVAIGQDRDPVAPLVEYGEFHLSRHIQLEADHGQGVEGVGLGRQQAIRRLGAGTPVTRYGGGADM